MQQTNRNWRRYWLLFKQLSLAGNQYDSHLSERQLKSPATIRHHFETIAPIPQRLPAHSFVHTNARTKHRFCWTATPKKELKCVEEEKKLQVVVDNVRWGNTCVAVIHSLCKNRSNTSNSNFFHSPLHPFLSSHWRKQDNRGLCSDFLVSFYFTILSWAHECAAQIWHFRRPRC